MAGENELLIRINGSAKDFQDELNKVKKQTKSLEQTLQTTAKAGAVAFAAFAGTIAFTTTQFAKYETALVGLGKTTDITGKRLESFGREFQNLSSEIPVSTNELLGIGQAAGQLGVTGEANILKFTETVAKLGVASDLTGEEGATALTRILNVTNEGIDTIDTFASVIVRLGNNFAATEKEIAIATTEVARASGTYGVGSSQAAAFGAAIASLGVRAQRGGTAIGQTFSVIDKALRKGGERLRVLERITGQTGEQLRKTFEEDSSRVFEAFVQGLGRADSAADALEEMGLVGQGLQKVILPLAGNTELFSDALNQAADEAKNATALNKEAAAAFDTLSSEAQLVSNNFTTLVTDIGEKLAPTVTELLGSINGLLIEINNLDESTVGVIATFLKWGAALTASITTAAAAGLAYIKLRRLIISLNVAFRAGRVAAGLFWGSVTLGLSTVITFLPEIISGFKSLIGLLNDDEEPKRLGAIDDKLKELNKSLEANKKIARDTGKNPNQSTAVRQIQERIDKWEALRQKKIEASEGFGTGELLTRPEGGGAVDTSPEALLGDQQVPLRPDDQIDDSADKLDQNESEKNAIISEKAQERIQIAQMENERLREIQTARANGATEKEIEMLERKQEIQQEFIEAEKIKNQEERELAVENLNLKHQREIEQIEEFERRKDERELERREQRKARDEALKELDDEQKKAFNEKELEQLREQFQTEEQIRKEFAKQRLKEEAKERKQFLKDEEKFGKEIAQVKAFMRSEEVKNARKASDALIQLQQSENKTLKGIGKAAARVRAAIKTAEGAIAAYTSLAGIPIVGPALGAAAAAAIISFGVEQQNKISAAQTGGIVPDGAPGAGARDRTPVLAEPGELIVPKAIAPNFIQAAGIPDNQAVEDDDEAGGENVTMSIELQDRASEVISLEQREGRELGLIER